MFPLFLSFFFPFFSECLDPTYSFSSCTFSLFLAIVVDLSPVNSAPMHYLRDSQISLFSNFFIKNGFYGTIHTFKNYFVTIRDDNFCPTRGCPVRPDPNGPSFTWSD